MQPQAQPIEQKQRTLRDIPPVLQWSLLLVASIALVWLLELIRIPAALLLGSMAAGIGVAAFEGRIAAPKWLFVMAQGVVGCLVARSIGPDILTTILRQWPIFLICVGAVIFFGFALGGLLARWKLLPGTTAIWGSTPGAATVMVLMADAFGGDIRLVAVMQYLRVAFVGIVASVVSRLWMTSDGAAAAAANWFPPLAAGPFAETLALAVGGAVVGVKSKIPAGALLVPMLVGVILSGSRVVTITLPPWLLAGCYALVGWSIGLRFTRPIMLHAARLLPRIVASILVLIALCGCLAYVLHVVTGTDALTAYLATSPGGADSVAIIAASSKVDLPFVMSMQIARMLLLIMIGPSLARMLVRWGPGESSELRVHSVTSPSAGDARADPPSV
jgi:membrane AbrB-like protein